MGLRNRPVYRLYKIHSEKRSVRGWMVGKGSAENLYLRNNEAEDVYEPLHIRLIDNCETDTVITIQHAHAFHSSISIMQIRDRVL